VAGTYKRYYPAFLDLEHRPVVVVGEGVAAEKRVRQLVRYEADVVVITARPSAWLIEAQSEGLLTIETRAYVRGDLAGAFVALCVSEDAEVQRAVYEEAESLGCLVNVAGEASLCNFILPSVVHREPLQIAISTGGVAPGVSKDLRQQLATEFGPEYGSWVALIAEVRVLALDGIEDPAEQQRVIAAAADYSVYLRVADGEELTAEALFEEFKEASTASDSEEDVSAVPTVPEPEDALEDVPVAPEAEDAVE
jgi:precorrin-2 dehydrogenase/sirohydrochlorin ferrochelatase